MYSFVYNYPSYRVFYQGQLLDSLLELKFLLMIESTHAWLREGLSIYYNINAVPEGWFSRIKRYTPDFLTRNWHTGAAELVEVKPDAYDDLVALHKRKRIAEKFIREMGYDWHYRVVKESDIILSPPAQQKFESLCRQLSVLTNDSFGLLFQNDSGLSDEAYRCFVKTGCLPATVT